MLNRRLLISTFAVAFAGLSALPAVAQTAIKFTLDWKYEGPAAGFLLALDKGYFKDEGLDVTIDSGNGSVDAIPSANPCWRRVMWMRCSVSPSR